MLSIKGLNDEEKLVHLKIVVKFEVLIEKKKMCSLGLNKEDYVSLIFFERFREEALVTPGRVLFEEDDEGKKK
ncbi:hypothetical protein Tco_1264578 [Tanacetum coccineum]